MKTLWVMVYVGGVMTVSGCVADLGADGAGETGEAQELIDGYNCDTACNRAHRARTGRV